MLWMRGRFAGFVVLMVLVGCGTGDGGTAGNTELNVVVPNNGSQSPDPSGNPQPPFIDIQTVEYTIDCQGNGDQFLDNLASFPDEVTLNGNLEVQDGRTNAAAIYGDPNFDGNAEIWQGFMDLPPGPCTVELRARDGDGEVICTGREPFTVTADAVIKVNIVLLCDISFQAPVGMLDLDGTFSFNVGNFCPDLFVLNCEDSFPEEQIVAPPPIPPVAATTCEVRFRDGDSTCGDNCDPQTCVPDGTAGLVCTGGPDPGVSTTVTCTDAQIDCDFNPLTTETECTFTGDTLGTLGVAPPNTPGAGAFVVACIPPALGGIPGAVATCTAVTTDGDLDCNKTKEVSVFCQGLTACQEYAELEGQPRTDEGANAACTANATSQICLSTVCDNTTNGGASGSCLDGSCCVSVPTDEGGDCSVENPPLGECQSGVCVATDCADDAACDSGAECTSIFPGICLGFTGICLPEQNDPSGTACDAGLGVGSGACDGAGTCVDICSFNPPCPDDSNVCTVPSCDPTDGTCSLVPGNEGASCDFNPGQGDGFCQAGTCITTGGPPCTSSGAPLSATVTVGCVNNVTTAQSAFPFTLTVLAPISIFGGSNFSVILDGVGLFPEFFLNAAQNVVPGGVRTAELVAFQATVSVRSGATGPDVVLGADPASLTPGPTQLCNFPPDQTCTVNGDCLGGVCNPPIILQDLPVVDGIPNSAGGCDTNGGLQAPPDCDCSPCAALDTPPDTTKAGQCALNGFCQDGDLIIEFLDQPGNYVAGPFTAGSVLWGWADNAIPCPSGDPSACTAPFHVDGCLDIPPPGVSSPTFGDQTAPTLIRVNASGLAVPIDCSLGSDGGSCSTTTTQGCLTDADCPGAETCVGVGVDDDIICPTPDNALIGCPIY